VATAHIVVLFAALVTLFGARRAFVAVRRADEGRQGESSVPVRRLDEAAACLDGPAACLDGPAGCLDGPAACLDRPAAGPDRPAAGPDRPAAGLARPAGGLDGPAGCLAGRAGRLDEPAVRRAWSQRCRQEAEALRDLDRALRAGGPLPAAAEPRQPPIEQLAFDLRRLHRQRRTGPTRESQRWLADVQRAYDLRLRLACRYLGVAEHLEGLEGIDRDIERMRIEHRLEAAGLALRS
jgi:hypothetical protein